MALVIFVSLSLREYKAPTTFSGYCLYSKYARNDYCNGSDCFHWENNNKTV